MRVRGLVGAVALVIGGVAEAGAVDEVQAVPTRPGVTTAFPLVRPAVEPMATVILFTGGNGALHLGSGSMALGGNFLVRSRQRFAQHGLLTAVLDAPSDHRDGSSASARARSTRRMLGR